MTTPISEQRGKKLRNSKQKLKERYAKAREDAQLAGIIHTTPEGAVRDERVDPSTQDEQDIYSIDRQAAMKGWSSSEEVKRQVVNRLAEVFFEESTVVMTKDGRVLEVPPDRQLQVKAANVLMTADQRQWERDNPAEAGKAKGSTNVNVGVQVNVFDALAQAMLAGAGVEQVNSIEAKIGEVTSDGPAT